MKRKLNISILSLLLLLFTGYLQAEEQLAELPSSATLNEINSTYSPERSTRDWWGEGPPTEGGGGGGAIGIPVGEGMLPLGIGGLAYLMIMVVRRRRAENEEE